MGIVSTHLKGISCNNVCYFKRCECIIVKLLQSSNTVELLRKIIKKISFENVYFEIFKSRIQTNVSFVNLLQYICIVN